MAQTTYVRQRVLVAVLVPWIIWTLKIDHHFFPSFGGEGDNRYCFLPLRHFAEPQTGNAIVHPLVNIGLHGQPPTLPMENDQCDLRIAVGAENANMTLQEKPSVPCEVLGRISAGNNGNPDIANWGWHRQVTLQ